MSLEIVTVNAERLATNLRFCRETNLAAMITGSPGGGKSSIVRQMLGDDDGFIDLRASQIDAVDLRGLPMVNHETGRSAWAVPDFLPTEGKGVLFLDEITSGAASVQAALYQLVLDRKIGDYVLPPGWWVVAAGNKMTDRAIVNRMSSALANRFVHFELEVNHDAWKTWALANELPLQVIAFLNYRPALLHDFDPAKKAYPTPRSWEFVSKMTEIGMPAGSAMSLTAGAVGDGAAAEYLAFLDVWGKVPDTDAVIMNPETTKIPEEASAQYAICTALSTKAEPGNVESILKYVGRMDESFQLLTMKDASKLNPAICQSHAFINWASENMELMA